ncbi:trypco2 family protein [Streptomyces sp. NPDC056486]|uniref:trypco2 family protein n=1 Tax=Streptomyces sp. NPDC056486 TaxID=3345835 RepID=UPI0036C429E7
MVGNGAGDDELDLADAITLLREQVAEAQRRVVTDGDQGVGFGLGEITVSLGMELAHTRGVDGGLRFSVVGLGGKRESTRRCTHTVTVCLKPHLSGGGEPGDVQVNDEDEDDG